MEGDSIRNPVSKKGQSEGYDEFENASSKISCDSIVNENNEDNMECSASGEVIERNDDQQHQEEEGGGGGDQREEEEEEDVDFGEDIEEQIVTHVHGRKPLLGKAWKNSSTGDYTKYYCIDYDVEYKPGDPVYIESQRADLPFYVCSVQELKMSKKDNLMVHIKWFYRTCEIPEQVYQLLVQDRNIEHHHNNNGVVSPHSSPGSLMSPGTTVQPYYAAISPKYTSGSSFSPGGTLIAPQPTYNFLSDPILRSRELFISEMSDIYPVSVLRGKCHVQHCLDIKAIREFKPEENKFFYCLSYNPETRRLASTQGEIRVGVSHQAKLPKFEGNVPPHKREGHHAADLRWCPYKIQDLDLLTYVHSTRSMAVFAAICDGSSTEYSAQLASRDGVSLQAIETLHDCNYNTVKSIQTLLNDKDPGDFVFKRWPEEDVKLFIKGLKSHGKNFFKIREEYLDHRHTSELVEFYYMWKKTSGANSARPRGRRHRHNVMRRVKAEKKSKNKHANVDKNNKNDPTDVSSCSESEMENLLETGEKGGGTGSTRKSKGKNKNQNNNSSTTSSSNVESASSDRDDQSTNVKSKPSVTLSPYYCRHCFTTSSKDWHHGSKRRILLCKDCRCHFKLYAELPNLEEPIRQFKERIAMEERIKRERGEREAERAAQAEKAAAACLAALFVEQQQKEEREEKKKDDDGEEEEVDRKDSKDQESTNERFPQSKSNEIEQSVERRDEKQQHSINDSNSSQSFLNNKKMLPSNISQNLTSHFSPSTSSPPPSSKSVTSPLSISTSMGSIGLSTSNNNVNHSSNEQYSSLNNSLLIPNSNSSSQIFLLDEEKQLRDELTRRMFPNSNVSGGHNATRSLSQSHTPSSAANDSPSSSSSSQHQREHSHQNLMQLNASQNAAADLIHHIPPHLRHQFLNSLQLNSGHNPSQGQGQGPSSFNPLNLGLPPSLQNAFLPPYLQQQQHQQQMMMMRGGGGVGGMGNPPFPPLGYPPHQPPPSQQQHSPSITPPPKLDGTEIHRSQSAIFTRMWNRGENNSCSRTDLIFKPVPDSPLARKREDRIRRRMVSSNNIPPSSSTSSSTSSSSFIDQIGGGNESHQSRFAKNHPIHSSMISQSNSGSGHQMTGSSKINEFRPPSLPFRPSSFHPPHGGGSSPHLKLRAPSSSSNRPQLPPSSSGGGGGGGGFIGMMPPIGSTPSRHPLLPFSHPPLGGGGVGIPSHVQDAFNSTLLQAISSGNVPNAAIPNLMTQLSSSGGGGGGIATSRSNINFNSRSPSVPPPQHNSSPSSNASRPLHPHQLGRNNNFSSPGNNARFPPFGGQHQPSSMFAPPPPFFLPHQMSMPNSGRGGGGSGSIHPSHVDNNCNAVRSPSNLLLPPLSSIPNEIQQQLAKIPGMESVLRSASSNPDINSQQLSAAILQQMAIAASSSSSPSLQKHFPPFSGGPS